MKRILNSARAAWAIMPIWAKLADGIIVVGIIAAAALLACK
jgi:hypothetical protein